MGKTTGRMGKSAKNPYWKGREAQLCIMSAMLGRTNMGFSMPTAIAVANLIKIGCVNLQQATVHLSGQYMEKDSDIKGFTDESEFIGKDLAQDGEKTRKYWGDCWKCYEEAEALILRLSKSKPAA